MNTKAFPEDIVILPLKIRPREVHQHRQSPQHDVPRNALLNYVLERLKTEDEVRARLALWMCQYIHRLPMVLAIGLLLEWICQNTHRLAMVLVPGSSLDEPLRYIYILVNPNPSGETRWQEIDTFSATSSLDKLNLSSNAYAALYKEACGLPNLKHLSSGGINSVSPGHFIVIVDGMKLIRSMSTRHLREEIATGTRMKRCCRRLVT